MPFFVISRSGEPAQPNGGPIEMVLLGGASEPFASRDAAEQEAVRLAAERPDSRHLVIEADSPIEAVLRSSTETHELPPIEVEEIRTWAQMEQAIRLRISVFAGELGIPELDEIDEYDLPRAWGQTSVHALGRLGAGMMPVATARLMIDYPITEPAHIGRVAVARWVRRQGYGRIVMSYLEAEARRRGFPGVILHAQVGAVPFYEALGYVKQGPVFVEVGLDHQMMELRWG